METRVNFKVLRTIEKVYKESEDSRLKPSLFKKIDNELSSLSEYFNLSKNQTFLVSVIFTLNFERYSTDIKDMAVHFGCNALKVLEFASDIDYLLQKEIIKKEQQRRRGSVDFIENSYKINEKIAEVIIKNKPLSEVKQKTYESVIDVLEDLYNLGEQREDDEISTSELFNLAESVLNSNQNIPFIKKITQTELKMNDKFLYLYLIWKTVTGERSIDISRTIDVIYDSTSRKVKYMQNILSEKNDLFKKKLTELEKSYFLNDTEIKLSETSLNLLKEEGIKIFASNKKKDNIVEPEKIKAKKLFYNEKENKQISLLKSMLSESKLKEIQKRLTKKNLPKGVTTLLYGLPGTGKTETVYQLAKSTNREIVKVDISQSKSMWFGESEKIIKRIFTDYKNYAKECKRTPILLFNEADAVISKRKEANSSNVSQTENTMQNIILEELENFEGIFFATTNLASNLDSAFERRFLFKIEFHKPDISVKAKIWKSKLPKLSASDCKKLASQFNFSGGQIDNIVRKSEMNEIINGTNTTIGNIIEFCETEELVKNNKIKIGFAKV